MSSTGPELTEAEILAADKLIERAMRPAGVYDPDERWARAILVANFSREQRARGIKGRSAEKAKAERRTNLVELLLRYVVDKKYRNKPTSAVTVAMIIDLLDSYGIEAGDPQVRRSISAALKRGPLTK